jgi:hypothetical protein
MGSCYEHGYLGKSDGLCRDSQGKFVKMVLGGCDARVGDLGYDFRDGKWYVYKSFAISAPRRSSPLWTPSQPDPRPRIGWQVEACLTPDGRVLMVEEKTCASF